MSAAAHSMPGWSRRAVASISGSLSRPVTSASGQRAFRIAVPLPGPQPRSTVPVVVASEGPGGGYTVCESGAILQYLADKTGKFLAKDGRARYDALQWMMVQMTTIGPMWGQYVHFMRFAPKGNDYSF